MKFSKEQIQKAILAAVFVIGGLCYYALEMVGPLAKREAAAIKEIAALEPKIRDAKSKIARTNSIEAGDPNADAARKAYEVMRVKIPSGQPVAWFPTRLSEFFKKQGISKQNFRCNPEPAEPNFPGYKASSWNIEFPSVGFAPLGVALAGLENQEGLMQITHLQIDATAKDAENHHAQIVISTLVKNEK